MTGAAPALATLLITSILAVGSVQAQTYTESVLHSFAGAADGAIPRAGLIRDENGNLYGTTENGGQADVPPHAPDGYGTVFKLDTNDKESVLYSFTWGNDGDRPFAGLVRDEQGNLYGTTIGGGPSDFGIVFKLDPRGNETVLYRFGAFDGDGTAPAAGLVRDEDGNLYGTTVIGGAFGNGTVFKLDPHGNETVLYSFTGTGGDGAKPGAGLLRDKRGNLYGTTFFGGVGDYGGNGTVFKLDPLGSETVLYRFTGTEGDGAGPHCALLQDKHGNLYGTTGGGGAYGGGTVFKLEPSGKEIILHSFGAKEDGAGPADLVRDERGNLYGTTENGGAYDTGLAFVSGTVFRLEPNGKETVLHSFGAEGDGTTPQGGLLLDKQGSLYGTTEYGGASNRGTVFKLTRAWR